MSLVEKNSPPIPQAGFARRIVNARSGPLSDPIAAQAEARRAQDGLLPAKSPELEGNMEVNPDPIVLETDKFGAASELEPALRPEPEALDRVRAEEAEPAVKKRRSGSRSGAKKSLQDASGAVGPLSAGGPVAKAVLAPVAKAAAIAAPASVSIKKAKAQAPTPAPVAVRRAPPKLPALLTADPAPTPPFADFIPTPASQEEPAAPELMKTTLLAPSIDQALAQAEPAEIEPSAVSATPAEAPSASLASESPQASGQAAPARGAQPPAPIRAARAARNSVIGMALAYIQRIEALFSPVLFLGRNIASVALALLHLAVPLGAAWILSRWTPAVQAQFWSGGAFEQALNFVGLWILCFFGWSLVCLLGSAIGRAAGRSLSHFQSEGEKFFHPK